ncbi:MAG TPA: glycosyltransferase family 2 protein [Myxococcota bacterium]|nr:glycosyltransferase family 2 protein [Myxococcota bacterium]
MSAPGPAISVVIPVHDEEENLARLHAEVSAALEKLPPAEIIFVDDGSRDGSLARMRALATRDPRVRVLALEGNHGQTAALDAGFKAVAGDITVTLDADLQNDPADIPRLVALLDRADCVNGVRTARQDGFVRKLSSRIGNGFRNWATREDVTDVGCSLRAMRSVYLRRVKLFRGMHRFLPTLLRLEGARVVEVPVAHRPRHAGRSKYGIGNRLFVGLLDVLAVRWMQSRALRYRVRD